MAFSLDNLLVIGISSRALFDLEAEEVIYRNEGLPAYRHTLPVLLQRLGNLPPDEPGLEEHDRNHADR